MTETRITFVDRIDQVRNGQITPSMLDMSFYGHLRILGKNAAKDDILIEHIVDAVDATEAYFDGIDLVDLNDQGYKAISKEIKIDVHPKRKQQEYRKN